MSRRRSALFMCSVSVAALLTWGLVGLAPRSVWIPTVLVVGFVAVAILLAYGANGRAVRPEAEVPFDRLPAEFGEHQALMITDVPLPSRREDYSFLFSATVLWSPLTEDEQPDLHLPALAVAAVLGRARDIARQCDPDQAALVRYELGSELGKMQPDDARSVRAMARSIRLFLPERDRERLVKLATLRKEKAMWEHERKYEQSRREYLGEDVLKDTGSAVVWWLSRNDEQVEKTVQDIDLLAQLASAANNTYLPDAFQPHPPDLEHDPEQRSPVDHFDAFMRSMGIDHDHPERPLMSRRFREVVSRHGIHEVADEMSRRFEILDDLPPDSDAAPPSEPDPR
ncbi:hypothetical protein GCM10027589_12970 [Actinocorallia lasiicapitis]